MPQRQNKSLTTKTKQIADSHITQLLTYLSVDQKLANVRISYLIVSKYARVIAFAVELLFWWSTVCPLWQWNGTDWQKAIKSCFFKAICWFWTCFRCCSTCISPMGVTDFSASKLVNIFAAGSWSKSCMGKSYGCVLTLSGEWTGSCNMILLKGELRCKVLCVRVFSR